MLLRQFEMPWRTAFEAYAAGAWAICIMGLGYAWYNTSFPDLLPWGHLFGVHGL